MPERLILTAVCLSFAPLAAAQAPPKPLVTGLKNPTAVAVGGDGRIYVTIAGELGKDGDGAVMVIENGKAIPFATGLDDPVGMAVYQQWLFVTDKKQIKRIDANGTTTVFAAADAFPTPPHSLVGITVDPESGTVYVSDIGDGIDPAGAIYRIPLKGK